jgi:hypothetical protein
MHFSDAFEIPKAKRFTQFYKNWSSSEPYDSDEDEFDIDITIDDELPLRSERRYPRRSACQKETQSPTQAVSTSRGKNQDKILEVDLENETELAVFRWAHHAWILYLRFCGAHNVPNELLSSREDLKSNVPLITFICVHVAGAYIILSFFSYFCF